MPHLQKKKSLVRRLITPVLLVILITASAFTGPYMTGSAQHLLVIFTMIIVLWVVGGRYKDKKEPVPE